MAQTMESRKAYVNGGSCLDTKNNSMAMGSAVSKKRTIAMILSPFVSLHDAHFAKLSVEDVVCIAKHHPLPSMLIISLLFFMGVEYTLQMVPTSSQPLDVGFILTRSLHGVVAASPALNSLLAAMNTVSMCF